MAGVAGSESGVATQENLGDGGKRLGLRPQRYSTREHKKPDRYKPASGHTTRGESLAIQDASLSSSLPPACPPPLLATRDAWFDPRLPRG